MKRSDATSLSRAQIHWMSLSSKAVGKPMYGTYLREDIAAHSITSEAESKMSQACNLVHQEMARAQSSKAWLLSFSKDPVNWKHSQILNAWMRTTYQEQKSCLPATLPLATARAGRATLPRYDVTFASVIRSADSQRENTCEGVFALTSFTAP